jgi:hypothetical protein
MNGVPDLSGVWITEPSPPGEIDRLFGDNSAFIEPGDDPSTFSKYFYNVLSDFKPEEAPIRPEAAELAASQNRARVASPVSRCLPLGIPSAGILSYAPFKIIQAPNELVVLYENDNTHRQIYTDGRKLPDDPNPMWLGYSTAKWDGDTLVVDTAGFNDKSRLDVFGHRHSEALSVQERYHRRDFGHMDIKITIEDSKMFTRQFTFGYKVNLIPDSDVLESFCNENEKDLAHLPGQ